MTQLLDVHLDQAAKLVSGRLCPPQVLQPAILCASMQSPPTLLTHDVLLCCLPARRRQPWWTWHRFAAPSTLHHRCVLNENTTALRHRAITYSMT